MLFFFFLGLFPEPFLEPPPFLPPLPLLEEGLEEDGLEELLEADPPFLDEEPALLDDEPLLDPVCEPLLEADPLLEPCELLLGSLSSYLSS